MSQSVRRCLLSLAVAIVAASCHTPPPTVPMQRVSTRAPLTTPISYPGAHLDAVYTPPNALDAATEGIDWLMGNPDELRSGPHPIAITAIAFCAAARDPRIRTDATFREFWLQELNNVIAHQDSRGRLSAAVDTVLPYEHAWATRALCEALAFDSNPIWAQAAQRAVAFIIEHQQPGGGWHYGYANFRQRSTPLTVAQMDALFAARRAAIDEPRLDHALQLAAHDLETIQDPQTGHFGYLMRGVGTAAMDGYALAGLQVADQWRSWAYRRGWLARQEAVAGWPTTLQYPLYAAYYSHKSVLRQGGLSWRQWADSFFHELLAGQQPDGSWSGPRQEERLGQAYATALSSLMIRSGTLDEMQDPHRPWAALPGPVYSIKEATGSVCIILSTWIEDIDAVLLDPVIARALVNADHVWIEGVHRAWIHQWMDKANTAHGELRLSRSREQSTFLRRWFDAPVGTPDSLWEEIPSWALAIAVWGHALEQAGRSVDTTVDAAVARRLRPGMRPQSMLPDDLYGSALASLSAEDQDVLLTHAIALAPNLAAWSDQMADAWCQGDEAALRHLHKQLIGSDPALHAIIDSLLATARAYILLHLLEAMAQKESSWFVIPAWQWFGENGLKAELETKHELEIWPGLDGVIGANGR